MGPGAVVRSRAQLLGVLPYRPRDPEVAAKYATQFPKLNLATIADFGGWAKAQPEHFGEGGVFDQIYAP